MTATPAGSAPSLEEEVAARLRAAVDVVFPASGDGGAELPRDPQVRPATRPEFGHLQSSLPLRLAGPTGLPPREIGARLIDALDVTDLCEPPALAGAGFVNLTLRSDVLAARVGVLLADPRLGVPVADRPQRVVVDLSSPNIAKQMHVGHLRSTVIGDALARVLAAVGHDVLRVNHVGDWGTQFGMVVEQVLDEAGTQAPAATDGPGSDGPGPEGSALEAPGPDPSGLGPMTLDAMTPDAMTPDAMTPDAPGLDGLDALYKRSRARFDADEGFRERARRRVVALQSGDPVTVGVWRRLVDVSLAGFQATYDRMGAGLTRADVAGESTYNDDLPGVVADLDAAGLLTPSQGALCWFDPAAPEGGAPLIVRKADGGFGYAATDLAAVRHRVGTLRADRMVYVVDARQAPHLGAVFALARAAGWLPDGVEARHVAFGTVLGEDGRPFRTRAGTTVSLTSLLDAAQDAAAALLDERGTRTGQDRDALARAVGVGAVKYADLSSGLGKDYVFSLDRMVATDGDTGPYLQYAHARTASVLDRSGVPVEDVVATGVPVLTDPAEVRLALALLRFGPAVAGVAGTLEPHRLCTYLYDLASALAVFWERCPVLPSQGDVRTARLALCLATKRVLAAGLDLLGIDAPERM